MRLMNLLCSVGVILIAQDALPETFPLQIAAKTGQVAKVKPLLDAGADVNQVNSGGHTALISAAVRGHAEVLRLLLARGADPAKRDGEGYSALDYGMERNRREAVVTLLQHWLAQATAAPEKASLSLCLAAAQLDDAKAQSLIQSGLGMDAPNRSGYRPLAMAARWGRLSVVKALLARKADPAAPSDTRYQSTPLMEATRDGHVDIASLLLDGGAPINQPDKHGDHALNWTAFFGHAPMIKLLVDQGAALFQSGQSPESALQITLREKHDEAAKILKAAGPRMVEAELLSYVEASHRAGLFNGAVLMAQDGKVVAQSAVGRANLEWSVPNTVDTAFRIGSLTKPLTATLVLRLVDAGKISLDAPLLTYLPDYRKDTGAKVTVRHLLSHTSGIPSFTHHPEIADLSPRSHRVADFVKAYCSGDLAFEPGSRFEYNNSGYYLLGALVERVTGTTYAEALKTWVFEPLKMASSSCPSSPGFVPRRAYGYLRTLDGWVEAPYLDASVVYSTGGVVSTLQDLLTWERALSKDGFLSPASRALMTTPATPAGGPSYGLGWFLHDVRIPGQAPLRAVSHGGEVDGFNSMLLRLPDSQTTLILLHNQGPTRLPVVADALVGILNGQVAPPPRPTILEPLGRTLKAQGVGAAVELARKLEADPAQPYGPFVEPEAGAWATYLLRMHRVPEAVLLFRLILGLHPDSWRAQSRLGTALLETGDLAGARSAFEAAQHLNPEDPVSRDGLARFVKATGATPANR